MTTRTAWFNGKFVPVAPAEVSPRAKTHNYLNLILAEKEVQSHSPEAWAVMPDEQSRGASPRHTSRASAATSSTSTSRG